MSPRRDILTNLAIGAAVASIVLTAIAFLLSFAHLEQIASRHGLHDERSWLWPAAVDLFIVIGESLMLRAALKGERDVWAIGLTVFGSAASIGFNIAGVGGDASRMDYAVAALPPTAALIAFGAVMRQVHSFLAARVETETNTAPAETVSTRPHTPVSRPVETRPETPTQVVSPRRETPAETRETAQRETTPRRPRETETAQVTGIGDRETETAKLLDLMRSRGSEMKVSLTDAMAETGRPKATAAKRLKAARDQYLAETA